jgi:hypothetical protein
MKRKIKLRDLTQEENVKWREKNCVFYGNDWNCNKCIFYNVMCAANNQQDWIYHKELYSEKFLNQEIEIGMENEELLSEEDKEYLKPILQMLKNNKIIQISKRVDSFLGKQVAYIRVLFYSSIEEYGQEKIDTQLFLSEVRFKKLESNRYYTLEELGL